MSQILNILTKMCYNVGPDYKQKHGWDFQCKYGCRLLGWFDGRRVKFFPDCFYFCSDVTEGQDGLKGKEIRTYVVIEGKSPG